MKLTFPLTLLISVAALGCTQKLDPAAVDTNQNHTTSVIYNGDSRQEPSPQNSPEAAVAKSIAIMFSPDKLKALSPSRYSVKTYLLSQAYPLCPNERFQEQPLLGHCTGSLIAANKVLTAAHCVDNKSSCEELRLIFGWNKDKAATLEVTESEIYKCKSILKMEQTMKGLDYAIIELDRPALGITPLALTKSTDSLSPGTKLLSLSYPLGLPLKKDLATVLSNDKARATFKVEVDTFEGSSGSPLLNAQGEIVGILSKGMEDILEDDIYRVQREGGCINFNTCATGTCFGETFFKADRIDL